MSNPTFNIANPIYIVNKSSDVDSRYGPWSSTEDANTNVDINIRDIGLTVGVSAVGVGVTEYWYKNGVQNTDLVLKTTGGGGSADLSIFYNISSDWTSSTNTVCSLSSNWNSVYSLVNTNSSFWNYRGLISPLTLGTTSYVIDVSLGNVFYHDVDRREIFSYKDFDVGKTIILFLSARPSLIYGNDFMQQFPVGTYFNNLGESNYLLTVAGKIIKATITNQNDITFLGSTEIFDLNQPTQRITEEPALRLDGLFGYYLLEDGSTLLWDDSPVLPPSQN